MSAIICKGLNQLKHPSLIKFHKNYSSLYFSDFVNKSATRSLSTITGSHVGVCFAKFVQSTGHLTHKRQKALKKLLSFNMKQKISRNLIESRVTEPNNLKKELGSCLT